MIGRKGVDFDWWVIMKALLNREPPPPGETPSFISHRGNTIKLGVSKSAKNIPTYEYQKNEFLWHHEGPHPIPASVGTLVEQKDFYYHAKRPKDRMSNPRADESKEYNEIVEMRKRNAAERRAHDIVERSHRTGYNVITGDIYGKGPKSERLHNRHIPDGLGPESHNRGIQQLKDSCNRYFLPQESGERHEKRQENLVREGVLNQRMQGIINVGKAETFSFGIEDQFSKSQYLKTNINGLVETRQAGKFTPRKCPMNNPSANPSIRSKWTTGVVLSTEY